MTDQHETTAAVTAAAYNAALVELRRCHRWAIEAGCHHVAQQIADRIAERIERLS